ncbi:Sua5/YciO/YrdC/YwlC family protein [Streptomyces sp. SCL15-6]|uniref:Sua5/YciO/YrdC/YwlC family protein n=1 Tax=Streptomyces sp. SCL15-6 TaxID=2967222 RepID=UPI002966B0E1|nr:Sua5/YciO/YrdC/YwlC family protein [Streptomyces sp. SCL15-6]
MGRRGSRTPGIGANAFDPEAVGALLAAKQRGADKPGSILVADLATAEALARTPA